MIDKNKLFSLFGSSDDDNFDEKKSIREFEKLVGEELEQPMNKLGMFVKLIINHLVFHQKLKKFLDKEKDKRVKKIIDMRYNGVSNKLTPWRKIAKSLGMSIQGVINIHNRYLSKFQKESENYV